MFQQLRWKIASFMRGRYGMDKLSWHLYYAALLVWLVSMFSRVRLFSLLYLLLCFFAIYRAFSRNIGKRRQEMVRYGILTAKVRGFSKGIKTRWNDRKTHRYFRCKCHSTLRVPKGRGKIEISCPKCGAKMIRRT